MRRAEQLKVPTFPDGDLQDVDDAASEVLVQDASTTELGFYALRDKCPVEGIRELFGGIFGKVWIFTPLATKVGVRISLLARRLDYVHPHPVREFQGVVAVIVRLQSVAHSLPPLTSHERFNLVPTAVYL